MYSGIDIIFYISFLFLPKTETPPKTPNYYEKVVWRKILK